MTPSQPSELQIKIMTGMGYWSQRITSKAPSYSFALPIDRESFIAAMLRKGDKVDFNPEPYVTVYREQVGTVDGKPCYRVKYGREEMILCPHLMLVMEKTT